MKSESEVAQSCPTLRDSMDCSLPGSSVLGIFQARVLEWGAIAFSGFIEKDRANSVLPSRSHLAFSAEGRVGKKSEGDVRTTYVPFLRLGRRLF